MLKRIAVLLAVLLLPVFAVAGFYGFVWWKVDSAAQKVVDQFSPFADIQYGRVHVDLLEAEVGLADISITPTLVPEKITISEVVLQTSGWAELLGLESALQRGEFPERLLVRQRGLEFSLNGALARQFSDASAMQHSPVDMPGLFCGEEQGFELARALGYARLTSDSTFSYVVDPVAGEAVMELDAETRQMASMAMSLRLQVQGGKLSAGAAMMGGVALKSLQVTYNDRGYNQRYRAYCAKNTGLDAEGFDQRMVQDFKGLLSMLGLTLTADQLDAVVSVYKPGVELVFSVRPSIPLGPGVQPQAPTPEAVMDLLNPAVEVNGQQVALAGIHWKQPSLDLKRQGGRHLAPSRSAAVEAGAVSDDASVSDSAAVVDDDAAAEPVAPGAARAPVYEADVRQSGFVPVAVSQVGQHVGARVRMITYYGRHIEGRIIDVTATEVLIEQRMDKGFANYAIAREKVSELEVYR